MHSEHDRFYGLWEGINSVKPPAYDPPPLGNWKVSKRGRLKGIFGKSRLRTSRRTRALLRDVSHGKQSCSAGWLLEDLRAYPDDGTQSLRVYKLEELEAGFEAWWRCSAASPLLRVIRWRYTIDSIEEYRCREWVWLPGPRSSPDEDEMARLQDSRLSGR